MRKLPPIIDGQRNVISGFYQDHHSKAWYIEAQQYLKERRAFVQERFIDCMKYLEVHSENCGAFSYQFASILRDCGSVFSSVLDAMIKGSRFAVQRETNIRDYKSFLMSQDNTIYLSKRAFQKQVSKGLDPASLFIEESSEQTEMVGGNITQ